MDHLTKSGILAAMGSYPAEMRISPARIQT
jgi:hypothetical protein